MPITFTCNCGKKYTVRDELSGKQGRCAACGKVLIIPRTSDKPDDELVLPDSDEESYKQTGTSRPTTTSAEEEEWQGTRRGGEARVSGWHIQDKGRLFGPFPPSHLKQLAIEGSIEPQTLVKREVDTVWFPAGRVKGLFDSEHTAPAEKPSHTPTTPAAGTESMQAADNGPSPPSPRPTMSTEVKCLGPAFALRKKQPWHLDVYDTYAIFTDPETSEQFRFPSETKHYRFAIRFFSNYNFAFIPYSRLYGFVLDEQTLGGLKFLAANQGASESADRKSLTFQVRFWAGFQLFIVAAFLLIGVIPILRGRAELKPEVPFLMVFYCVIAFLAVNAWRLRKWAILGEAILFTASSVWNAVAVIVAITHGHPPEAVLYLAGSIFVASQFFRTLNADLGSDSTSEDD